MPNRIPFAPYAPDVSDNESATSKNIINCLPQGDGYGPFPGTTAPTNNALPAQCRGSFVASNPDGTLQQFAGTNNKLYALTAGSWVDWTFQNGGIATVTIDTSGTGGTTGVYTNVPLTGGSGSNAQGNITVVAPGGVSTVTIASSQVGSGYQIYDAITAASSNIGNTANFTAEVATLSSTGTLNTVNYTSIGQTDQWQWAQFNNTVLVTNQANALQAVNLPITVNHFSNVPGSPPNARFVSVVNGFVVLSGLKTPHTTRLQWSDLDNFKQWTPGVGQSDFQDLPEGGNVLKVAGFDLFGVIFQDRRARLMQYVGGDEVFQITAITGGDGNGLFAPYAMAVGDDKVFWLSNTGFKMITPGGSPNPIGKERVDRTFFSFVSSKAGQSGVNLNLQNVFAVTDASENRVYFTWPASNDTSRFDAIYCYDWALDKWTKINQAMEFLDGSISVYRQNKIVLGAFDTNHLLQNYEIITSPLEAVMETAEQGDLGQRLFVSGFRPITDAQTVYGSISYRDTTFETASGSIAQLSVTSAGGGGTPGSYTNVPLVGGSGTGATVNVGISGGLEGAIVLSTGGTNYGLTSVKTVTVTNAGSSTSTGATFTGVTLNGGSGSGALASITISSAGSVSGTPSITTRGSGYTFNDTLTVPSSQVGGVTGISLAVSQVADTTSLSLSTAVVGAATASFEVTLLGPNYTAEAQANTHTGIIPFRKDTRYSRAKIRIPANVIWNFARGIDPEGGLGGLR